MDERKKVSRKQERDGAHAFGGRVQGGSGSGRYQKGDVRSADVMVEFKTVLEGKTQITVKAKDLDQLRQDALIEGRIPVFGVRVAGRDYLLIEQSDYLEMRDG